MILPTCRTVIKTQTLKEFMTEAIPIEEDEGEWLLYVDGLSTHAGRGAGSVLISPEGDELDFALRLDFRALNNKVEYKALIVGIKIAINAGVHNLKAYFDPQQVTNQEEGTFNVKEERMKEYLQQTTNIKSRLKSFQLHRVARTENNTNIDLPLLG
ncbi:UNVERIFIED_CONTAM: hypothetical protein Slati_2138300 [Sesamum latifolium]|uniref:RNase H type-1 domain-containing protein n=1 Tax=Sesamum latifolium TaxID=2727402 RepID=A0AAW2WSB2_9LAMI